MVNSESLQMHWGVRVLMYSQNWHCWDWAMAGQYLGPWIVKGTLVRGNNLIEYKQPKEHKCKG